MAGGKGGTTTSKVEIPEYIEDASKSNLARADQISQIGYTPYFGPDVAAMAPGQLAAMDNTNTGLEAFGLSTGNNNYLPEPQTFAGGVQGYSSAPLFQQSLDTFQANRPGQFNAINDLFINPVTGEVPSGLLMPDEEEVVVDPETGQKKKKDKWDKATWKQGGSSKSYEPTSYMALSNSPGAMGGYIGDKSNDPGSPLGDGGWKLQNPVTGILDMFK